MRTSRKPRQQPPELADAEFQQHRRVVVLEAHFHQLRQRIQPRNAVVDLKDRLAARLEHAAALVHEPLRVRGVLHDAVGEDEIERAASGNGSCSPSATSKVAAQPLLREIGAGQLDRRRREVDAGDDGAAPGEPGEVDAGAAADFENRSALIAVKSDEPQQVVELFEMVLVEIVEEAARADRMPCDLEVVNVLVPVVADVVDGRPRLRL